MRKGQSHSFDRGGWEKKNTDYRVRERELSIGVMDCRAFFQSV